MLDGLNEENLFLNDKDTAMKLTQQLAKTLELRSGSHSISFCAILAPWKGFGLCVSIVYDDAVSNVCMLTYDKGLEDCISMGAAEQDAYLRTRWIVHTTRPMVRMILEHLIQKNSEDCDQGVLQLYLDNVDLLPEKGLFLAEFMPTVSRTGETVYCWLVQLPEAIGEQTMVRSKLLEFKREKESSPLFPTTAAAYLRMVMRVCDGVRALKGAQDG